MNQLLKEIEQSFERESKLKFPSPKCLKDNANRLESLIKRLDESNEKEFILMDLDTFKADIIDIEGDYKKSLKRYKKKWLIKKSEFKEYLASFNELNI